MGQTRINCVNVVMFGDMIIMGIGNSSNYVQDYMGIITRYIIEN